MLLLDLCHNFARSFFPNALFIFYFLFNAGKKIKSMTTILKKEVSENCMITTWSNLVKMFQFSNFIISATLGCC